MGLRERHTDSQIQASVLANLFEHVVEESQAGRDVALAASVQIHLYIYIGFFRRTTNFRHTLTGKKEFSNLVPLLGGQRTVFFQTFFHEHRLVVLQINGLATEVLRQLHIGVSVAYHEATCQIVFGIVQVLTQHTRTWLACRSIVFRETSVDEHFIEGDAFILQRLHHEVMHRPEGIFGERRCTQAILIGHHGKLEIELATDESQVAKHFRIEL